jgi:enolase
VQARQIFDSRGNPTVEAELTTEHGKFLGVAPSGASTGIFEALELRDGGKDYMGKGVHTAVKNVNTIIAPALIGKDVTKQRELDDFMVQTLDGSKNENGWTKSKLGANAILAVSIAICRAAAVATKTPLYAYLATLAGRKAEDACVLPIPFLSECGRRLLLHPRTTTCPWAGVSSRCRAAQLSLRFPVPRFLPSSHLYPSVPAPPCPALPTRPSPLPADVLNGGEHSGAPIVFQEFMIAPVGAASFTEAMKMGSETFHALKALIKKRYGLGATGVGDEGGFAPDLHDAREALDLLVEAIRTAGYEGKVKIAMDVAASEFAVEAEGKPTCYDLGKKVRARGGGEGEGVKSGEELLELYADLSAKYPIVSIEDPFEQQDSGRWVAITARMGEAVQIVGDDATVTNPLRVKRAIDEKWCNALLT